MLLIRRKIQSLCHHHCTCFRQDPANFTKSAISASLYWWWWSTIMATSITTNTTIATTFVFGFEMPYFTTRGQSAFSRRIIIINNNHNNYRSNPRPPAVRRSFLSSMNVNNNNHVIDFQSDAKNFGRGDLHLSAALSEHDVVVYQTGTWLVDGVPVGDSDDSDLPPSFEYAAVDNLQIVWSHNCEHGVIRGWKMKLLVVSDGDDEEPATNNKQGLVKTDESVEFGPEQLVARIPVLWLLGSENDKNQPPRIVNAESDNADTCVPTVCQELTDDLWRNPPVS
jgi:hypothetical protein